MTIFELREISPRSLFNKLYGHLRDKREKWEQTRLQCFYSVFPHMSKEDREIYTIDVFMPFDWDEGEIKPAFEKIKEDAEKKRAEAAEAWKKIDAIQNN